MSPLSFQKSENFITEASSYLAGGVSSNFRLGMLPGPLAFTKAEGPILHDVDGNRLIDYYLGMGPMILGHNPEAVHEKVAASMADGILFGGQSKLEVDAAKLLCEIAPVAERVRFSGSGSEAVQGVLRLARAATGRTKVIKFEGHYHGWFDNVLWSNAPSLEAAGPREAPNATPLSKGQEEAASSGLVVLPWNDLDLLKARLAEGDIAAVIMEPAMCNSGAISPRDGYLEGAKEACEKNGSLLIFDETITGFRLSPGGAQQFFGVTPHLATFAKAMANGFQVAAITGPKDLMELFATGGVLHGGTYNSQLLSMAATIATLESVSAPGFHDDLANKSNKLQEGITKAFADAGVQASISGFPGFIHIGLGLTEKPQDYRDLTALDKARYRELCHAMLKRGVRALERGAWFVSSTHTDDVLDETIAAIREAAVEIA
ncbi:aspartate aminotransferase family protein [Ruegeria sp. HKCCD8929]|uniref:aspartate aminotransferase family protein n=1 Tax=Ruegeria sp. HKCCD8929 TaxID=2683006 RepID=UPI00148815FF|nr:aspartate aminotransferase family protein [Ruegeria sp. HKCCD8929]